MSRVRIVLILTENWTMRPAPDVADLVTFAIEAERAGLDAVMVSEHVVLGPSADAAGLPANPRDYALADWDALVSVNLTGAFYMARAALPALLRARGSVVSVASVAALRASAEMGGYAVTKAGLVMLTQSLAVDHAHQGLRANVVCPGWTVTEMADAEMAAFGAPRGLAVGEAYQLVTSLVPARRPASASEVAAVVAWLLSDASSYVNGAVIPVDGAAVAMDVGTLPFDPRVEVRPDPAP
jgi:NAD(P)-dependent dehydrogenase (short-subunit alcohol dehydrogenase family)